MTKTPDGTSELELLRAVIALGREADIALELAIRDRNTLEHTVATLLPMLARHTAAQAVWLRTWDDNLELRDFSWTDSDELGLEVDDIFRRCEPLEPYHHADNNRAVISQPLEVAGQFFGAAALRIEGTLDDAGTERARRLLEAWCEVLDNFVAAIAHARRKHLVTRAVADALKNPLLHDGIAEAIAALNTEVPIDDLLLVYRHENHVESLDFHVLIDGELRYSSLPGNGEELRPDLRGRMHHLLVGEDPALPGELGFSAYQEEVLINGVRDQEVIGRLILSRRSGEFNTFDRDLLERFADYLRQRIVDFNREWKVLSLCFPRATVVRLLREADYAERFLSPREREVAVLFCDIAGFTRVSEQILVAPALIGELIDTWSERVVEIVWDLGGVYDKMVGDCIIAHWGPPFYDWEPAEACRRAAEAAMSIRDFTRDLQSSMPRLRDIDFPFGVTTSLNYCPLFVGRFGPDEDFTGFSSGMNNTARLQGLAACHEILCMNQFVSALNQPERFGEELQGRAKNVAEPLLYRSLRV